MHHRSLAWLFLLALLTVSAGRLFAQGPAPAANSTVFVPLIVKLGGTSGGGAIHTGEATYYSEADGGGNCLFDPTPQDLMVGAMNHTDYANSAICGAYVELTGPNGTITIRIVDQCPECPAGNIDLSPSAFAKIAELSKGRVPITWRIISPDISGPIRYSFKDGSSQWWTAVQIRNHRNPIAKFEYLKNGQFTAVPRTDYNYFVESSGMGPGPYTFRVTDMYGNVLTDSGVTLNVGGEVAGSAQFPKQ
jgi:expansin (peptidoglycan-binding protein)